MTTAPATPRTAVAADLAALLHGAYDRWTIWREDTNGVRWRAKLSPDDHQLDGDGDCYGEVKWAKRDATRPKDFDGAARVVHTDRFDRLWWQPPEDAKADAGLLARLEQRVRGYYRNDWSYVVLFVERASVKCAHCGERTEISTALGALESDMPEADIRSTLEEQMYALEYEATEKVSAAQPATN